MALVVATLRSRKTSVCLGAFPFAHAWTIHDPCLGSSSRKFVVSATSLSAVPVPPALTMGMLARGEGYTVQNTLLDFIVGGCKVFGAISVINATQPDEADTNAPVVGAGAPYKFAVNAATRKVDGCKDKNNQTVDFNICRSAAAYSAFFKFATDRVIGK